MRCVELIINTTTTTTRSSSHLTEPRSLLSKQGSLSNTPRIHTTKGNSSAVMIPPVQFRHGHHVTNLGVFVGLGTEEGLTVGHGNGVFGSGFKALEFAQIGLGVDESSSCFVFLYFVLHKNIDM